jgi:hypothetical protein
MKNVLAIAAVACAAALGVTGTGAAIPDDHYLPAQRMCEAQGGPGLNMSWYSNGERQALISYSCEDYADSAPLMQAAIRMCERVYGGKVVYPPATNSYYTCQIVPG